MRYTSMLIIKSMADKWLVEREYLLILTITTAKQKLEMREKHIMMRLSLS